jgi:hypothetical protein
MCSLCAGIISGQLNMRDWDPSLPEGRHPPLPEPLPPPTLPQALLLNEQQPYMPPCPPQSLHLANQMQAPMHFQQHTMLQPPAPYRQDGGYGMVQWQDPQHEPEIHQDMHCQGGGASGLSTWTPMAGPDQTDHPAHDYGGVAQLPLEPYHSAGDQQP